MCCCTEIVALTYTVNTRQGASLSPSLVPFVLVGGHSVESLFAYSSIMHYGIRNIFMRASPLVFFLVEITFNTCSFTNVVEDLLFYQESVVIVWF